jgi:hypothetical protein
VKVELGDVRDVRAYVCAIVNRRFRSALESHGDEIISEGVAVMFELHERWIEKAPAETFQHFCNRELTSKLLQWLRSEDRMRGIRYRNHAGDYVDLGRQSIESMVAVESEPALDPVFA